MIRHKVKTPEPRSRGTLSRRSLIGLGGLAGTAALTRASAAHQATPEATPVAVSDGSKLRQLDFSPYRRDLDALTRAEIAALDALLLEQPVGRLLELLSDDAITSFDLTRYYLDRIERYDVGKTNAVLDLDPRALDIARDLDRMRSNGASHGALHGIPVLLKDSISTGDGLFTTAGAAALATHSAGRDSFLVEQLREAGAIILGKTNLTEWSNWMHVTPANGFSAVGGQTYSPYGKGIDPSGSSTGSAVAATMNFAPLTIGAETIGSIISPSARSSVVGVKPSLGLVSRSLVIPISDEMDTAGPIARSVSDAALALSVLAGSRDPSDRLSRYALGAIGSDFTRSLRTDALEGVRVGLVAMLPDQSDTDNLVSYGLWDDVDTFHQLGSEVIMVRMPLPPATGWPLMLNCDMHLDVDNYLSATDASYSTLLEITRYNEEHPEVIPLGQELLYESVSCTMDPEGIEDLAQSIRQTMSSYLEQLFELHQLDMLVGIDDVISLQYALAGWPAVTVPRQNDSLSVPSGFTMVGPYLSDAELLGRAYAYEQASRARRLPILVTLDPSQRT